MSQTFSLSSLLTPHFFKKCFAKLTVSEHVISVSIDHIILETPYLLHHNEIKIQLKLFKKTVCFFLLFFVCFVCCFFLHSVQIPNNLLIFAVNFFPSSHLKIYLNHGSKIKASRAAGLKNLTFLHLNIYILINCLCLLMLSLRSC